jgi:hypothetical protein
MVENCSVLIESCDKEMVEAAGDGMEERMEEGGLCKYEVGIYIWVLYMVWKSTTHVSTEEREW